jgi:hypothetical protein
MTPEDQVRLCGSLRFLKEITRRSKNVMLLLRRITLRIVTLILYYHMLEHGLDVGQNLSILLSFELEFMRQCAEIIHYE